MTPADFAQMVDYVEDWWGPSTSWDGAARLVDGFLEIDVDAAFEVLLSRQSNPELATYPPRPAQLKAEALQRMRAKLQRQDALPESPETRYDWAEYSRRAYGEVIPLAEAMTRRHAEVVKAGQALQCLESDGPCSCLVDA